MLVKTRYFGEIELEEDKIKLILSFLYPFGAYLYAFKNIGSKTSLIVLYIFYLFYGWTFIPQNVRQDAYRYAERFYNAQTQYSRDGVRGIIEGWQEDEAVDTETEKDIFIPIMIFQLFILQWKLKMMMYLKMIT